MIYPKDNIKVYLITNENKSDYSEGTISIDIVSGINDFERIGQIPDAGQLTLVSRNTNLDPHTNNQVAYGSIIEISTDIQEPIPYIQRIFYGFITDVNIEYDPTGKENIVTINVSDIFGLLKRSLINESFENYLNTTYPNGLTMEQFINSIFLTNESGLNFDLYITRSAIFSLSDIFDIPGGLRPTGIEPIIKPVAGENILDIIQKYTNSNLYNVFQYDTNIYTYSPYFKYSTSGGTNAQYWLDLIDENPNQFPIFSSDGNNISYKSIQFDDGLGRTINQILYNNNKTTPTIVDTTYGPYIDEQSISNYGVCSLEINSGFSAGDDVNTTYEEYANTLLQISSVPSIEAKNITFDRNKWFDETQRLSIDSIFGVPTIILKHEINESLNIHKYYQVVGELNTITPYAWQTTYTLAKHPIYDAVQYQENIPQITINAPTKTWDQYYGYDVDDTDYDIPYLYYGDSNNNFTATINNIDANLVDHVDWYFFVSDFTWKDPSNFSSEVFATTNGLSYTFNHDVPIGQTGTGGYPNGGPGIDKIAAMVVLKNGWKMLSKTYNVLVTTAETHAGFSYTKYYGTVTFTDTSYDAQSWSWNFGDGSTSNLQNPVHTYAGYGTYNVTLTVSNGVDTDSITIPITLTITKIVVNYVKFEWKGVANLVNGVWDKEWMEKINYIDLVQSSIRPATLPSDLGYINVEKIAIKGNVYKQDGTTIWPAGQNTWNNSGAITVNADQILTDYSRDSTYVQIKPLYSPLPNYNKKEYDVSLILKVREEVLGYKFVNPPNNATVDTLLTYFENMRLYFYKNSWTINKQYQPIKVYVSADNNTWYEIGYIAPIFTSYIPTGVNGYGRDSLVATVPMPPQYP